MTTDQEAEDEIGRWGGEFIGALEAVRNGGSSEAVTRAVLGDRNQSPSDLSYRLEMMLMVGSWVSGALMKRAHPSDVDGSGFFGLDIEPDVHPSRRAAAQLVVAGANGDNDQTSALVEVQARRGDKAMSETLAALVSIAAPTWDRKPVDL